MSLFDDLSSQLSGALGGAAGQHPALLGHVADLVNNPATGGFNGLVQAFHDHGLGGVVSSWIGTGANQSISADQISKVLGPERVQLIAGKLGVAEPLVPERPCRMPDLPSVEHHLVRHADRFR